MTSRFTARTSMLAVVGLALLPGCLSRSVDDLKSIPRAQMLEFIVAAPKSEVDKLVPSAAARADLNVEERPARPDQPWVLGRPIKLETAAFWVRVDTVAYEKRTRVFVQMMLVPKVEGWTAAADIATFHFMLALTSVSQEAGVWQ